MVDFSCPKDSEIKEITIYVPSQAKVILCTIGKPCVHGEIR